MFPVVGQMLIVVGYLGLSMVEFGYSVVVAVASSVLVGEIPI